MSDAQLTIAREYGFASWPRLKAFVESPNRDDLCLPKQGRITERVFRAAVYLLDSGDVAGLQRYLLDHPDVIRQRDQLESGNYFGSPTLLEFVAENPTRHGTLPENIVEVARVILRGTCQNRAVFEGETLTV